MKWNQLSGKAAEDKPWVNYIMPVYQLVHKTRGENRESRRAKDREVRLELKHIVQQLPKLKPGTDAYKEMDLRMGELQLYEASPHMAINKPYAKEVS